jgi:hypothetical protein
MFGTEWMTVDARYFVIQKIIFLDLQGFYGIGQQNNNKFEVTFRKHVQTKETYLLLLTCSQEVTFSKNRTIINYKPNQL